MRANLVGHCHRNLAFNRDPQCLSITITAVRPSFCQETAQVLCSDSGDEAICHGLVLSVISKMFSQHRENCTAWYWVKRVAGNPSSCGCLREAPQRAPVSASHIKKSTEAPVL